MNEEEFAKFLGTFVQAVWTQLVQVSLRPGQARRGARPLLCAARTVAWGGSQAEDRHAHTRTRMPMRPVSTLCLVSLWRLS